MYNLVDKYKNLLKIRNTTQTELIKVTKIHHETIQKFTQRGTIKIPILQKIADYFDVPITYFFSEENSEKDLMFFHYFSNMTDKQQNFILDMMKNLKDNDIK